MQEITIGKVISNARNRMGISQRELARKTNIDNTTIAKIEKDLRTKPDMLVLRKIAYELKIDEIELFRLSGYSEEDINIITKYSVISLKDMIHSFSKLDLKSIAKKLSQKLEDKEEMLAMFNSVVSLNKANGSIDVEATKRFQKEKNKIIFLIDNISDTINLINEQLENVKNNNQNNSDIDILIYNYLVYLNIESLNI